LFSFAESGTSELDCLTSTFIADVFGQLFLFCWWVLQIFAMINGYRIGGFILS
jgi:hypothetical protein